jgi:hypothetical protein
MKRLAALFVIISGTFLLSAIAYAHHSLGGAYDATREVKLEGKIVGLLFQNPHSLLEIQAPDRDGKMDRWSLEWHGVGQLVQQGIKRDTLKLGDVVVITMNPSRAPGELRGVLLTLRRKSDGFAWDILPKTVD